MQVLYFQYIYRANLDAGETIAAQHSFDLLSESLVHQSVHERINSRVKQDQYASNSISDIAVWGDDIV